MKKLVAAALTAGALAMSLGAVASDTILMGTEGAYPPVLKVLTLHITTTTVTTTSLVLTLK